MSTRKPLLWVGSSKKDLKQFPADVQDVFGHALDLAQSGKKHPDAKPLKGFGGAGILELIEDFNTNTYRAAYTVRFGSAIYVLQPRRIMRKDQEMIEIEESSGNVYADLGTPDSNEMRVKSQLAAKIGEIIKARHLTQVQASEILGLSQPKLSEMLRGKFRGISEAKMMECLLLLGRDVQIVVKSAPRSRKEGRLEVVFS